MALVVACGPTDFLGAGPGDALYADGGEGFALHEALLRRIDGVSEHHVVQFPPFGGGEITVCGCVVPTVQTTSAKTGETGLFRARWSTFWAQWCLSWSVVRTQASEHAR